MSEIVDAEETHLVEEGRRCGRKEAENSAVMQKEPRDSHQKDHTRKAHSPRTILNPPWDESKKSSKGKSLIT